MKKNFMIGDEWLFYKLYCGYKSSDKILTDAIKPVTEELLAKGVIDKWFYIRYADPDLHLRVRFHYNDKEFVGTIINSMNTILSKYTDCGIISKVMTDVYERELNRYGDNTIVQSESIFFADSVMITNLIDFLSGKGESSEQIRWRFGLKAVDRLLSDFGLDLKEKLETIEKMRDGFNKEFGIESYIKRRLNDNFREVRKEIEEFMNNENSSYQYYHVFNSLLDIKSISSGPIIESLLDPLSAEYLQVEKLNYIASLSHMLLNRLFRSNQRAQEMVLYNYLWKYYDSLIARQKYIQKKVVEINVETAKG